MTKNIVFDRWMFALLFVWIILGVILAKLGPGNSLDARWFYTGDEARFIRELRRGGGWGALATVALFGGLALRRLREKGS